MKKLAAFAAAFLLALTVALVPLAVSDLGRPGAQPSVEAQQAGPLPDIGATSPYEYYARGRASRKPQAAGPSSAPRPRRRAAAE